jgi:hypothetical protein
MTRKQIEDRRAALVADRQMLLEQAAKTQDNICVYNGAIEDCEYWLRQIAPEEAKAS